jgi:hypothetical protein
MVSSSNKMIATVVARLGDEYFSAMEASRRGFERVPIPVSYVKAYTGKVYTTGRI